jgi:hypothetical protein
MRHLKLNEYLFDILSEKLHFSEELERYNFLKLIVLRIGTVYLARFYREKS